MRSSSSEASGSSISISRGLASSARPIATRCFSPPDSRSGLRSSRWPMPSSSTTWSSDRHSARRAARTSGHRARFGRPSCAGTAARPGRHSRCGAGVSARRCRVAVSTSTRPSTTTRPRSGRISPAMMLTSEVLPEPDAPNSAVSRPPLSKAASSVKAAQPVTDVDRRASFDVHPPADAARQRFGDDQRDHRDGDGRSASGAARRRRRPAPA